MGKGKHALRKQGAKAGTLGTFAGVFTPSILTILGIILFLRLGFVVGNAGLGITLIILMLANGISILTTFSLSAIATVTFSGTVTGLLPILDMVHSYQTLQRISPPNFMDFAFLEETIPAEVETTETPRPLRIRGISLYPL